MSGPRFDDRDLKDAELRARLAGKVPKGSVLDQEMPGEDSKRQTDERERQLVAAAQQGDADAFAELAARYWVRTYQLCTRYVWNKDIARDLAREAALKVWVAHEGLDPERYFGAYLAKVAERLCIDWMRHEKRQGPLALDKMASTDDVIEGQDGGIKTLIEEIVDPLSKDPERRALFKMAVDRVIQQLSPSQQRVFRMRFVEGYTRAEIAKEEGCTEQNVGYHERRAIALFKKYFREEWDDNGEEGSHEQ